MERAGGRARVRAPQMRVVDRHRHRHRISLSLPPQFGKCVSINLQGLKRFSTLHLCLTATQVQREALFLRPVASIYPPFTLPPAPCALAQLYPSIDSFVASTRQTQTIKGETERDSSPQTVECIINDWQQAARPRRLSDSYITFTLALSSFLRFAK